MKVKLIDIRINDCFPLVGGVLHRVVEKVVTTRTDRDNFSVTVVKLKVKEKDEEGSRERWLIEMSGDVSMDGVQRPERQL